MTSRRNKTPDGSIPDWYPDIGDRVYVPSFNSLGTVLEICPRLLPFEVLPEEIYYLVQLDEGGYHNQALRRFVRRQNEKTLLTIAELQEAKRH